MQGKDWRLDEISTCYLGMQEKVKSLDEIQKQLNLGELWIHEAGCFRVNVV